MLPGSIEFNLQFPFLQSRAGDRSYDPDCAHELLSRVGLSDVEMHRDVKELSGGERHRLALVRGLLWNPPVLLADEPLAGLDEENAGACFDLLATRVRRSGHTGLVVLHHRELAQQADMRLFFESGRLEEA